MAKRNLAMRLITDENNIMSSDIEICMTTFKERFVFLPYLYDSLQKQTIKIDHINVFITKDDYEADTFMKEHKDFFHVYVIDEDYKSYNKIVHALKLFPEKYILTIDDDRYYDKNRIYHILMASNFEYPTAYKVSFRSYENEWEDNEGLVVSDLPLGALIFGAYIWGAEGVLYPPRILDRDELISLIPEFPTTDDILISMLLIKNGYPVQRLFPAVRYLQILGKEEEFAIIKKHMDNSLTFDAINDIGEGKVYDKCYELNKMVKETKQLFTNNKNNIEYLDFLKVNFLLNSYKKPVFEVSDENVANVHTKSDINNVSPYIISFTTFPKRINQALNMLQSLWLQNNFIYKVVMNIDKSEWKENELNEFLSNKIVKRLCEINYVQNRNLKTYNKLIPTAKKYPNFPILTIDDDVVYDNSFLKIFTGLMKLYDEKLVVGIQGREFNKDIKWEDKYIERLNMIGFNKILEGVCGIYYPKNVVNKISKENFDFDDIIKRYGYCDDIYLTELRLKLSIPSIYCVNKLIGEWQQSPNPTFNIDNNNKALYSLKQFQLFEVDIPEIIDVLEPGNYHHECFESIYWYIYNSKLFDDHDKDNSIVVYTVPYPEDVYRSYFKSFKEYVSNKYDNVYFGNVDKRNCFRIMETYKQGDAFDDFDYAISHDYYDTTDERIIFVDCEESRGRDKKRISFGKALPLFTKEEISENKEKYKNYDRVSCIIGNVQTKSRSMLLKAVKTAEENNELIKILSLRHSRIASKNVVELNCLNYEDFYKEVASSDCILDIHNDNRLTKYSRSSSCNASDFYGIPYIRYV